MSDKKPTCDRCGWPLYEDVKDGCVPGNCSQRPLPPMPEIIDHGDEKCPESCLYIPGSLTPRPLYARCLVIATIGNRVPDILSIRQPQCKFRMEIIDHGDAHRPGLGAYNWKGYKYHNINRMFASGMLRVEDFDYFWFPDDDVVIDCEDVHRMFLLAHQHGLRLCQPSMAADSTNIGWLVTKHVPGSIVRFTNFVEILAPCFSAEALKICLPTFMDNYSGWGLDFVWPKSLGYEGVGVIDAVSMKHTGVGTSGDWTMPNGLKPWQELHRTMSRYGLNYAVASRNVASF